MKRVALFFVLFFSQSVRPALATWTSLAPDFSGVQADTLTVVSSVLGIMVIVVGLGILIRVMLK